MVAIVIILLIIDGISPSIQRIGTLIETLYIATESVVFPGFEKIESDTILTPIFTINTNGAYRECTSRASVPKVNDIGLLRTLVELARISTEVSIGCFHFLRITGRIEFFQLELG